MSVDDDRVRADDERRLRQLEHVKGEVRAEVNRELHVEAVQQTPSDANQAADVAKRMKEQAFREVSSSDAALVRARRLKHAAQVVDYAFYVLYAGILVIVVLELAGANSGSPFMRFMNTATGPFLAPFRGLMPSPRVDRFQFMGSYVAALVIYLLVHKGITGALKLLAGRAADA